MSDPMAPLDPVLRELGREHRARKAPASVERALAAEFRRRHRRAFAPWLATAAAVAGAGALAFFLLQAPPEGTPALRVAAPAAREVRLTPRPQVVAAPAATVAAVAAKRAVVRRPSAARPPAARPPVDREAVVEIATDFFPLRPGPVLEPGELAQVIRARVPRRELLRFGLTAAEFYPNRAASEDVRADVVFGHDGTARAIRFVRDYQ